MIVHFYATLRVAVGKREVEVLLAEGATISQLVSELTRQYPALRQDMVDHEGNLLDHIHLFINGKDIVQFEHGVETRLSAKDVISIFPPIGGG
jgi:molybdopterin synthase sulfur carrier subunit